MKIYRTLLICLLSANLSVAFSQDQVSYDGSWQAKVTAPDGWYTANVELKGQGGTWQALVTSIASQDPCVGRRSPVVIVKATQTNLSFMIKMSEALHGCPDSMVNLRRVDENSLSGNRGRQSVFLVRQ